MSVRKIVVTHWLADFSFSLPSIRLVIDSGLELRSVSERNEGEWSFIWKGTALICLGLVWGLDNRFTVLGSGQNPRF